MKASKSNIVLERSLGTHDGGFHADEVTATALLLVYDLIDLKNIVRSRDLKRLRECEFVCDVGGLYDPTTKRFDHHQSDYKGNLSSAGMVLEYLHQEGMVSAKLFKYLKETLFDGIDAIDNGLFQPITGHCSFSLVISNFMPASYSAQEHELDEAFFKAVSFARDHLERSIHRFEHVQKCSQVVKEKMVDKGLCMHFEEPMPWMDAFFENGGEEHPALFIIMPGHGKWKLRGIPPSLDERMNVRRPLPEKWAGLIGDELKQVSEIDGAVFCHKGRFISVWETLEDAERALEIALKSL
ncbi:MAG: MYG1 family protein [Simkaniaceae bacterium]|nr:MYG1 family protein [Simkaniaceae bacterium]